MEPVQKAGRQPELGMNIRVANIWYQSTNHIASEFEGTQDFTVPVVARVSEYQCGEAFYSTCGEALCGKSVLVVSYGHSDMSDSPHLCVHNVISLMIVKDGMHVLPLEEFTVVILYAIPSSSQPPFNASKSPDRVQEWLNANIPAHAELLGASNSVGLQGTFGTVIVGLLQNSKSSQLSIYCQVEVFIAGNMEEVIWQPSISVSTFACAAAWYCGKFKKSPWPPPHQLDMLSDGVQLIPSHWELQDRDRKSNGCTYEILVCREMGALVLQYGWDVFAYAHHLEQNEYLVFKFCGSSSFPVQRYNSCVGSHKITSCANLDIEIFQAIPHNTTSEHHIPNEDLILYPVNFQTQVGIMWVLLAQDYFVSEEFTFNSEPGSELDAFPCVRLVWILTSFDFCWVHSIAESCHGDVHSQGDYSNQCTCTCSAMHRALPCLLYWNYGAISFFSSLTNVAAMILPQDFMLLPQKIGDGLFAIKNDVQSLFGADALQRSQGSSLQLTDGTEVCFIKYVIQEVTFQQPLSAHQHKHGGSALRLEGKPQFKERGMSGAIHGKATRLRPMMPSPIGRQPKSDPWHCPWNQYKRQAGNQS